MSILKKVWEFVSHLPGIRRSPLEIKDIVLMELLRQRNAFLPNTDALAILELQGPNQYVIKVENPDNLRNWRIEIPKNSNPCKDILVYQLERTNNVVEDIDQFYKGPCFRYHSLGELMSDINAFKFMDEWIIEDLDRSTDIVKGMAFPRPTCDAIPADPSMVYYQIIDSVKLLQVMSVNGKWMHSLLLSFKPFPTDEELTYPELNIIVPAEDARTYNSGVIFVINYKGKHAAFKFSKARKFLSFTSKDWGVLKQLAVPRSYNSELI